MKKTNPEVHNVNNINVNNQINDFSLTFDPFLFLVLYILHHVKLIKSKEKTVYIPCTQYDSTI